MVILNETLISRYLEDAILLLHSRVSPTFLRHGFAVRKKMIVVEV